MSVWQCVVAVIVGMVGLALCLPCGVLLVQVVAGRRRSTQGRDEPRADNAADAAVLPPWVVLMPAHNEAQGIADTVASVRAACRPQDRILVVADNCSDATAALARSAGAEVIERQDADRRGKGYALDFGVRHLERTGAPEVVLLVDADCRVSTDALHLCASATLRNGRPSQALYLMDLPPAAEAGLVYWPLKARIGAFAWAVKNRLRPSGGQRLGWPCQLMGSGMAFTWAQLRDAPLASGHLVEDMKLGIDLALAGRPPQFVPEAEVRSLFPTQTAGLQTQRTRWEHGHLGVIVAQVPRLLGAALRQRDLRLLGMAADLGVPPLASLALLSLACAGCLVPLAWLAGVPGAIAPLLAALLALGFAILLAWRAEGRALVGGGELLRLPVYILAKLPLYLGWIRRRQTEWVRTTRDAGPGKPPEGRP